MKFRTSERFDRDVRRLKREHYVQFATVVKADFVLACDDWAAAMDAGQAFIWPKALRVGRLHGRAEVFEMTWSFAAPDGRATFALVREGGEWFCVWRRVGDHGVFANP